MSSPTTSEQHTLPDHHEVRALPEHASPASTGLPNDAAQHPAAPPQKRKSSWLRLAIILLVVLAAIAGVVYRIRTNKKADQKQAQGAAAAANRPVPVAFDVVQQRAVPIYLQALGTVTAYNTVTLKSRVDGQIVRVNFREGQSVTQGQLLIEIDPRPYQAALAQAQGNYTRDQANAANADAQQQRYNQLYAAGVVSREQAQAQESTAGQAVGTLASDRAAIESARVNLAYTRITSPINGIVGLRQVDMGNIIAANSSTGLVVLTQVEPIAVIFTLPEDQLPQVFGRMRGGHQLTAEAWDRANTRMLATGNLLTVDNQIDTTTGTAKLKAVFNNVDGALFPNQFVNIRLVLENRTNAVTLPAAAVQTGSNGSYVYVVDMAHPIAPQAPATGDSKGNAATSQANPSAPDAAGTPTGSTGTTSSTGTGTTAGTAAGGSGAAAGGGSGRSHGSGRGGAGGGAGSGGNRQTSYPVRATPIVIDLTQGSTVVVRSGVRPGDRVVTDGEEKLKDGSKVIPRPAAVVDGSNTTGNASAATPPNPPDTTNTRSTRTPDSSFNNNGNGDRDAPTPPAGTTGTQQNGHRPHRPRPQGAPQQ